ncbi:response regulator [Niallia sp. FSL M8-0099]|uniref:response regulator n=1 Tax=Niallia sp. FSL M8-0099 TaxID=2954519 RepID=UPI0030FB06C2
MRVIIIDDEKWAIEVLVRQLNRLTNVNIVKTFTNPLEAYRELPKLNVDVVFLDIEMGEVDGLEFAAKLLALPTHMDIIFVTAYNQYALDAFEVNAIDYLIKPVTIARLKKTFDKLRIYGRADSQVLTDKKQRSLYANVMGGFQLLDQDESVVKWRTKKVKELFIYLWQHKGILVHKTKIIDNLWTDIPIDKSLTLLHTSIYQLRKTLKILGLEDPIVFLNDHYKFDCIIKNDIDRLLEIFAKKVVSEEMIEEVLSIYKGDYLEEEDFEWAIGKQKQIKSQFVNFLEQYIEGKLERVEKSSSIIIKSLEKLVEMEPYSEKYLAYAIRYLGEQESKQELIRFFEYFQEKWSSDLDLPLPKELFDLYQQYIVKL